ncbi:unnamed protein product [Malus baccata var. baccata]
MELLDKEEQEWQVEASTSQLESKEESCREELERAIQMAECIYDLDGPDDLPESPELPPPEVQDPPEVIDLGTDEDPRPIQISGLLGVDDRAKIICLLQEFKDCFAWHYTEMPGLDSALCAFGVRAGNFLGFLVHQRGVEVDKNKSRAIMESPSPTNKVQLQRLLGKINFLRRFIANLTGKIQPLTLLLRLKDKENFEWGPPHQQAFDNIKAYLTSPPVLVPPQRGKPLKLYISASEKSIGSLLAQNNEGGKEQAVYYLSRILTEVETRYSPVERLCLALYFTASKLRHYMLPCHVHIIAKTDVIKYMLSKPMLIGRIGNWILALSEFSFQYVPQRAVKGQAIADFLADHQESQSEVINIPGSLEVTSIWIPPRKDISGKEDWVQQEIRRVTGLWITHWKLYFDGSHTHKALGAGIVIINPQGVYHYYSFLLDYQGNTNNRAEYEALIIGLEILMDLGAVEVEVFGDSELVINQLNGEFKCIHITMAGYYLAATQLLSF